MQVKVIDLSARPKLRATLVKALNAQRKSAATKRTPR